jgi:hypothetical protein
VRDTVLECYWKPDGGPSKTVQIVLSQSTVKEVLREFHGGFLGEYLGVNKTLDKVQ